MYLGLSFWVSRKKTGGYSSRGILGILCSICSNNYISRKIPRIKAEGCGHCVSFSNIPKAQIS